MLCLCPFSNIKALETLSRLGFVSGSLEVMLGYVAAVLGTHTPATVSSNAWLQSHGGDVVKRLAEEKARREAGAGVTGAATAVLQCT